MGFLARVAGVVALAVGLAGQAAAAGSGVFVEVKDNETAGAPTQRYKLYGASHALVIGIDDYQDAAFPDLKHAVRDAEGVAQVLIEKLGFPEENVRLLRNDAATNEQVRLALDDWALLRKRASRTWRQTAGF